MSSDIGSHDVYAKLEEYVKQLGRPYRTDDKGNLCLEWHCTTGQMEIAILYLGDRIEFRTQVLANIAPGSRAVVREVAFSIQGTTEYLKFEEDGHTGIVASWHIPIMGQLPPYEQFAKTISCFACEVDSYKGLLEDAAKITKPSSGSCEDVISEAAMLHNLGRDLVSLAKEHTILPVYVRENLLSQLMAALSGPCQQILLVGESGTGKNALVQALATRIAQRAQTAIDAGLEDRRIYECTPASFEYSVFYAHHLENKIQQVAENCRAEHAILFIDQVHSAVTAGRLSDQPDRTVANLLLPFMSRNEITIIGATDENGLVFMQKENPNFTNRFHIIRIPETTMGETEQIVADRIRSFKRGVDSKQPLQFAENVGDVVIDMAERFLRHQFFPGKALTVLNEVVALSLERAEAKPICAEDVYDCVVRLSGLERKIVSATDKLTKEEVEQALAAEVLGQPEAVSAVADVVIRYKAGLTPRGRPIATMLFTGPTGVGKTQLARSLARYLLGSEDALLRYDMSEYADPLAYSKLCGNKARGEEGRLTKEVRARPFAIILLDELEKADRTVCNALLQVLDAARMTDDMGKTANFENTIIIMTSNVGAHLFRRGGMGFSDGGSSRDGMEGLKNELERVFSPEFLNRFERTICFRPLTKDVTKEIARREISALQDRLGPKQRRLRLLPTETLLEAVACRGYDSVYGARAMQRTVEAMVTAPLAAFLAANPQLTEQSIRLDWGQGALVIGLHEA